MPISDERLSVVAQDHAEAEVQATEESRETLHLARRRAQLRAPADTLEQLSPEDPANRPGEPALPDLEPPAVGAR